MELAGELVVGDGGDGVGAVVHGHEEGGEGDGGRAVHAGFGREGRVHVGCIWIYCLRGGDGGGEGEADERGEEEAERGDEGCGAVVYSLHD